MQFNPQSRLRLGLCSVGIALVTVGAICLVVSGGAGVVLPAFSSYDRAHDSVQCHACLDRVQRLFDTEHDALSAEVETCRRIQRNCVDRCGLDLKDCKQE